MIMSNTAHHDKLQHHSVKPAVRVPALVNICNFSLFCMKVEISKHKTTTFQTLALGVELGAVPNRTKSWYFHLLLPNNSTDLSVKGEALSWEKHKNSGNFCCNLLLTSFRAEERSHALLFHTPTKLDL